MAKEKAEDKVILEREYIIPLRSKWLRVPKYKRANKAIKAIKEFIARHMKIDDRDLRKVKIDKWLNHEIWFRGIKKPPAKIKIKAKKYLEGKVTVELSEIPQIIKYLIAREEKQKKSAEEKKKEKEAKKAIEEEKEKLEEKVEETKEEKKEEKIEEKREEEKAEKEEGKGEEEKRKEIEKEEKDLLKKETKEIKEMEKAEIRKVKHVSKEKKVQVHRMALKK